MARRRRSSRFYTLGYLIARQPKTIAKIETYRAMRDHYLSSPALRSARIPARAYRLLNEATLAPHHLSNFYRTYRLPEDPFFPLFLATKSEYRRRRAQQAEERRRWIQSAMRSLPEREIAMVRYLGHLERALNAAGRSPLWEGDLYPRTKKRAGEYLRFESDAWFESFRSHLTALSKRYPRLGSEFRERIMALYILRLIPDGGQVSESSTLFPPRPPAPSLVAGAYRRLSLEHHPDRGGNPEEFIRAKWARDTLSR